MDKSVNHGLWFSSAKLEFCGLILLQARGGEEFGIEKENFIILNRRVTLGSVACSRTIR